MVRLDINYNATSINQAQDSKMAITNRSAFNEVDGGEMQRAALDAIELDDRQAERVEAVRAARRKHAELGAAQPRRRDLGAKLLIVIVCATQNSRVSESTDTRKRERTNRGK